jgi:ABC-type phosphate transport system permease subunit
MILAQKDVKDIFGTVKAPPGPSKLYDPDVGNSLGALITTLLQITFIVAAVLVLFYLLSGALDWITSEGEKDKLEKARGKILNAIIGIILMVVALALFSVITGNILGIIDISGGGIKFELPHF